MLQHAPEPLWINWLTVACTVWVFGSLGVQHVAAIVSDCLSVYANVARDKGPHLNCVVLGKLTLPWAQTHIWAKWSKFSVMMNVA